jgi:hypothetical protein
MMPPGWLRSKRGNPYPKRSGLTAAVYPGREGGFIWRIAPWRGLGAVDAPTPLATEAEAMEAAERALPSAQRQFEATQAAGPARRLWWRDDGDEP